LLNTNLTSLKQNRKLGHFKSKFLDGKLYRNNLGSKFKNIEQKPSSWQNLQYSNIFTIDWEHLHYYVYDVRFVEVQGTLQLR